MGRIFLLLIVAGAIYGGYGIYQHLTKLTNPDKLSEYARTSGGASGDAKGQDTGEVEKEPPAPSSIEKIEAIAQKDPLPVLSSNHEWIQIEAWAIVRVGQELPDGSRLESWDETAAVVVTVEGARERRRFRRPLEVLSKLQAEPVVAASSSTSLPWSQGQQDQQTAE
jgi:hypothetical protein